MALMNQSIRSRRCCLLLRLVDAASRCLVGASVGQCDGCSDPPRSPAAIEFMLLAAMLCRALPLSDGKKNGIFWNGFPGSGPPIPLLMEFMELMCSLSDAIIRSFNAIPSPAVGLNPILLPVSNLRSVITCW